MEVKKLVLCSIFVEVYLLLGIVIVITTYNRKMDITVEDRSNTSERKCRKEYIYLYNNTETPTETKEIDGLPKSAQLPEDDELAKLDNRALLRIYWKYINKLQILCKDVIRVGNLKDGGKEICIDPGYKPEAPCLVYSFGIKNMFDFDYGIVEKFGCDVYSFDPSMTLTTRRMSEHIWFYKWGLDGKNEINSRNWNMKTLDTIRRELGHTNRTLDILKIDIEGDEWNAIPQMISSGALDNVRQISLETHFSAKRANFQDYWGNVHPRTQLRGLRELYDLGYRTFMRERNMFSLSMWLGIKGFITSVNEVSMIKPKFKKDNQLESAV